MQPPPGLSTPEPNQVCKLLKSLYGLKQSSRQWFARLSSFLNSHGFSQSNSDCSLFIKSSKNTFTVLLIYVDDLILAGNDIHDIELIKTILHSTFKIKDLGPLK